MVLLHRRSQALSLCLILLPPLNRMQNPQLPMLTLLHASTSIAYQPVSESYKVVAST